MSEYVKSLRRKGLYGIADYVERLEKAANPVRHGRWYKPKGMMPTEHMGRHRCSECNCLAYYERLGREGLSNYCPNCGAKMDGDVNGKND